MNRTEIAIEIKNEIAHHLAEAKALKTAYDALMPGNETPAATPATPIKKAAAPATKGAGKKAAKKPISKKAAKKAPAKEDPSVDDEEWLRLIGDAIDEYAEEGWNTQASSILGNAQLEVEINDFTLKDLRGLLKVKKDDRLADIGDPKLRGLLNESTNIRSAGTRGRAAVWQIGE